MMPLLPLPISPAKPWFGLMLALTLIIAGTGWMIILPSSTASAQSQCTSSFGAKSDIAPITAGASFVTTADFNNDGKLDLAVANGTADTVSVLLGDGTGGSGAGSSFPVGRGPHGIGVGDFNGDDRLDLAIANVRSGTVSVLLGDGAGGFGAALNFPAGSSPFRVSVGDFNSDGKPDLAVTNALSASEVSILMNNTPVGEVTSSFGAVISFAVAAFDSVVVSDFNGDSKPDLATTNAFAVSIFLNRTVTGATTVAFDVATEFPFPGRIARSVAAGDFNNDGKADLVVASFASGSPATVSILPGDGEGGFGAERSFVTGAVSPSQIVAGDFNGDGKLDLAIATSITSNNDVSILLGDGTGNLGSPAEFAMGEMSVVFMATGDFNADGMADLTVLGGRLFSKNVSVFLNTTTEGATTPSFGAKKDLVGIAPSAFFVTSGRFDDDFNLDLAVTNPDTDTVSVLSGNGAGGFGNVTSHAVGQAPAELAAGDFNGDGRPDLAVVNSNSNDVSILLGVRDSGFRSAANFAVEAKPLSLAVSDFNGDGKADLAVANFSSNTVSFLPGDGAGGFGPPTNIAAGTGPISVTAGHFNSDGKADLAVANFSSNTVSILLNTGTGSFEAATSISAGANPIYITVKDFNDDGKADLAVANFSSNTVSIFPGNGAGGFGPPTNFAVGDGPGMVTASDFNGDGHLDLAASNFNSGNVSILLGDGAGRFSAASQFAAGVNPNAVAPADLDNDGRPDLAVANFGSKDVSIRLNTNPCVSTFTVTNTDDSGPGSLRQMIESANARPGTDTIAFEIEGPAPYTINPLSPLPIITDPVIIDGRTQSGFESKPVIVLNGGSAGATANGLHITAGSSRVRGLVINNFGLDGVRLEVRGGNIIEGNYIGTDVTGTAGGPGNKRDGVSMVSSFNTVGGTDRDAGNIIAFNGRTGVQNRIEELGITHNRILSNSIFSNTFTAIDVPVPWQRRVRTFALSAVRDDGTTTFFGTDFSSFATSFGTEFSFDIGRAENIVQFFSSTRCREGQSLLSPTVTTGSDGRVRYTFQTATLANRFITATVTRSSTSEFSLCFQVSSTTPPTTTISGSVGGFATAPQFVRLSGSLTGVTRTEGGNFSFTNLIEGGTYTVTPIVEILNQGVLRPRSITFTDLRGEGIANFLITVCDDCLPAFLAKVQDTRGRPIGGVTVAFSGPGPNPVTVSTDITGTILAPELPPGMYTITPSKPSFSFNPPSLIANIVTNVVSSQPFVGTSFTTPLNDLFSNAQPISGSSNRQPVTGSNAGATKEDQEPNHAGRVADTSVWYRWQAPGGGSVTFTTAGSNFDTRLAVYTGIGLSNLTPIASNDNVVNDLTSRVTFNAEAGTVYYVAVDSVSSLGDITLNWSLSGSPDPPPVVGITSPTNGAVFTAPVNITINADASDGDGTVIKVEFFAGDAKLGEDTTAPYSFAWNGVAGGNYSLTAVATDNTGASTTSNPVNITVNQPPNTIQFSSVTYHISEAGISASVIVSRSGDTLGSATVDFTTGDAAGQMNCNVLNTGTASSRCDYETTVRTLRFAASETSKTISIPVIDDSYSDGSESFTVTLSNATGASLASPSLATVTITDNDAANGANPIDQAGFFVRLHYIDFFSREPDASGLAFWTDQITSCGTDTACIELRRINVSAAFFISIEFQKTGYVVYLMYKAAYGNLPGGPVPVRFHEFLPDTQQIGLGVVVGQAGWEQVLENNKNVFAADFVARPRFAVHPTTLSPAQFVDALFANAAVIPTQAQRDGAIGEFGSAADTSDAAARGRALRRVAENPTLAEQEFNKAFVLMQYLGYLRRNPNDAPDGNFDGYNFWLGKLNQFNGNFVSAQMVKAFIDAGEYKHRFGP
ncbi:MAG: FG-GAP-like repeat-containing protein [Pyrinomonadaceae bacterium]